MFDIPTIAEIVSSTTAEAGALTTQLLPLLWLGLVVVIAVVVIGLTFMLIKKAIYGAKRAVGASRGGRRRRR